MIPWPRGKSSQTADQVRDWLWELARTPCADRIHFEMLMRIL
jgi:hypothetical protein